MAAVATSGAKTGGNPNPPSRSRGEGGMTEEGTDEGDTPEGKREGRRKQINTGEQEGPANERTDAKSSVDQRRDASQSTLCVSCLSSLPFCSVSFRSVSPSRDAADDCRAHRRERDSVVVRCLPGYSSRIQIFSLSFFRR